MITNCMGSQDGPVVGPGRGQECDEGTRQLIKDLVFYRLHRVSPGVQLRYCKTLVCSCTKYFDMC